MPQKPRSRKRQGRKGAYAVVAVVVIAAIIAVSYYYLYVLPPTPVATVACSTTTDLVYANINTSKGLFEVELFPSCAPKTVANFVNLAKSGFYNNLVWHRIVDTPSPFVIQTGDPLTRNGGGNRSLWGTGGSSQTVPLEVSSSLHNDVGYLGMARGTDPNSGSSQFYINLSNNTSLDGSYTVFGKVINGMNVVDEIASTPVYTSGPYLDQPITPVYVTSIAILSSGP